MAIPRPAAWTPVDDADFAVVADLLGRHPQGHFEIVLRHDDGTPRVIRNAPILGSGRPMPTLYWLVSPHDRLVVSRLESTGAVDVAEAEVALGEGELGDDCVAVHVRDTSDARGGVLRRGRVGVPVAADAEQRRVRHHHAAHHARAAARGL